MISTGCFLLARHANSMCFTTFNTAKEMSSICWNFRCTLHWWLSKWKLLLQPMAIICKYVIFVLVGIRLRSYTIIFFLLKFVYLHSIMFIESSDLVPYRILLLGAIECHAYRSGPLFTNQTDVLPQAALTSCLSNFRMMRSLWHPIPQLRHLAVRRLTA